MCDFLDNFGDFEDFYAYNEVTGDTNLFSDDDTNILSDDIFTQKNSFDDFDDGFSDDDF